MPEIQASRRLVKSPPELWAEVSDAASLARHLGEVGEIRITRLEPETTVAWEGEHASGTVELAPAGWGTSVTFTAEPIAAEVTEPEPVAEAEPVAPDPAPEASAEPAPELERIVIEERPAAAPEADATPEPKRSWFQRLFGKRQRAMDADRAGGDEDARPAAEGRTGAHPESTGRARSSAEPEPEPQNPPEPQAAEPDPLEQLLVGALDSLGQAHHRPSSRG